MKLSNELVSQFAQLLTEDHSKKKDDDIIYGIVHKNGVHTYVQLDGSDVYTPVVLAASADEGDRVGVMIRNHSAMAGFNISSPSVNSRTFDSYRDAVSGQFDRVDATYITAENANLTFATIANLEALQGQFDKLDVKFITIDQAKIDFASVKDLEAVNGKVSNLEATTLKVTDAELKYATIDRLKVTEEEVGTIRGDVADFKTATAENFKATNVEVVSIRGDVADFKTATAENFKATNAEITTISGDLANYKTVIAGQFEAVDGKIQNAVIGKADITDLTAVSTRTDNLEAGLGEIKTLVNGNLTSDNIQSLTLNSKNTVIENGTIKNAMIESLAFDKISGVDINTTKFTVHSDDGRSKWEDNTIQISDATRVRVQIGKDASDDYTLAVWDKNGKLIWDALGATEHTIQRPIIRNDIVAADAAIAGSKLDIPSIVTEINGCQTKISSSVINVDQKNQTLSAVLNTLETTASDNLDTAKAYADGQLSEAQKYALEQANNVLAAANAHTDSEISGISEITTAHTASITVMQGQISSLITEDSQINGKYDALVSRYNSMETTVSGIQLTLGEHTTVLNAQKDEIVGVKTTTNSIITDINGIRETISGIEKNVESKADGSQVSEISTRVSEIERNADEIRSTVKATSEYVESMSISGRNLLRNSRTLLFDDYSFGEMTTYATDENGDVLLDENDDALIA